MIRRNLSIIGITICLLCLLAIGFILAGCAPNTVRVEVDHQSHLLVGYPFTPQREEDNLTVLQGTLEWGGPTGPYLDAGLGYNLQGANGGGFYGPSFTGTLRAGYAWKVK